MTRLPVRIRQLPEKAGIYTNLSSPLVLVCNEDEYGTIASDELNAQKSRVLLMLTILAEKNALETQEIFYTY